MIGLIVVLLVVGMLWYLGETYVPMPPPMRVILRVVILIAVCWYVLAFLGLLPLLTATPGRH